VIVQSASWLVIGSKAAPAAGRIGRRASMAASWDMACACSRFSQMLTFVTDPHAVDAGWDELAEARRRVEAGRVTGEVAVVPAEPPDLA
jgi:hypothetical protein